MKGQRGPFQTSITINVQNLVVDADARKLLKWDPERPEVWDTIISYSLQCAQRKRCNVKISVYSVEGWHVMDLNQSFIYPDEKTGDTIDFAPFFLTWQDIPILNEPIPLPKGLYTFDIQVIGACPYDQDKLRSENLSISGVSAKLTEISVPRVGVITSIYCLDSKKNASQVIISFFNPILEGGEVEPLLTELPLLVDYRSPGIHAIPFESQLQYAGEYWTVIEARDDHPESNKAHQRKWALPRGASLFILPCAHYGFKGIGWFEDTDGDAQKAYDELGQVYNPNLNKMALCYSGWYPLGERGGVLINKPRSHAFDISEGFPKGTLFENTIWTFSGHGSRDGILFGYDKRDPNNWLWKARIDKLPDGALSGIKVAVILSCYSAPEFITALVQKGARCAVGFEDEIAFFGSAWWNGWFWELLTKKGMTVEEAAMEATIRTWWIPDLGLITYDVKGDKWTVIY